MDKLNTSELVDLEEILLDYIIDNIEDVDKTINDYTVLPIGDLIKDNIINIKKTKNLYEKLFEKQLTLTIDQKIIIAKGENKVNERRPDY